MQVGERVKETKSGELSHESSLSLSLVLFLGPQVGSSARSASPQCFPMAMMLMWQGMALSWCHGFSAALVLLIGLCGPHGYTCDGARMDTPHPWPLGP